MKVILFLLLTLQLIAIVQSQASGDASAGGGTPGGGTPGGGSSGGSGDNSVLPTQSSDPTNPGGGSSQVPNSSQPAQSGSQSSAASPASSRQEDTATPTADNTPPATPTDNNNNNNNSSSNNNNNSHSRSNGRTRSGNNNTQGNYPTNSPSDNGSTGDNNNGNNSNSGSNNQEQGQSQGDKPDNVGTIAGSVVGGVVGLALIGGLLTWLNRRGGCTSRTKRRNHDTFDDFAMHMKDPENANMSGGSGAGMAAGATAGAAAGAASGGGMSPVSPFQRRMAPIAPQTTGYMNLGNDEYSETSTAVPLMNQDMAGYPSPGAGINQHGQPVDPYYGYGNADYKTQMYHQNDGGVDHWQNQQQPLDQQQHQYYGAPITSPQSSNQPELRQMKPDTIEYKPHEI